MQTIKIRNLDSTEDNTITDNSYLALALNENDVKRGSEDPNDLNSRITVKTTISQLKNAILPAVGSSPPLSENEEGGIDVGIGEVVLDENGDALVPQPPVVIKQGGKDQVRITDDGISLKENVVVDKTLSVTGPAYFNSTTFFDRDVFFNALTNDPSPTEGKIYRKYDGLYFDGSKLLTEGQGGKWVDGDSSGDIVYNAGKVGIGTTSPTNKLTVIGNVSAHAYEFYENTTSSASECIHRPTTGEFAIRANSQERLRIDSDGNVGIGTTTPTASLDIVNTSTTTTQSYGLSVQGGGNSIGSGYSLRALDQSGNVDFFVRGDGNVGIGTDAPKSRLHIPQPSTTIGGNDITKGAILVGDDNLGIGIDSNEIIHTGNMLNIGTYIHDSQNVDDNSGVIRFNPNKVEAMRIRSNGNVGIGTDSPDYKLDVNGDINFTGDLYKNGVLFAGGGGSSNISDVTGLQAALDNKLDKPATNSEPSFVDSDINLKTNISPIKSPIKFLENIRGVNFEWKEESNKSGEDQGLIAQEVEKIIPSAVKKGEDGYLKVDYTKLVPFLLEAVKDLSERVKELEKN